MSRSEHAQGDQGTTQSNAEARALCVCGGGCKAKDLYGETPSEQTDGQTRLKTLHFPQLRWRAALKSALCQVEVSELRLVND